MVARARAARDAGVEALYVGDHHVEPAGFVQNNVILGRIVADWPGAIGSVYLLPLWNPVLLAEQVGTLAAMATGGFVLQAALGHREAELAAFGVDRRQRVRRFEESLGIIRGLLAGEEVSGDGLFPIESARIAPTGPVRIWIAGQSDNALDRAARLASGWVAPPGVTIAAAADLLRRYREACARAGRPPGDMAIRRDVFVGDTRAEAETVVSQAVAEGYRGFDPDVLMWGDSSEVARQVESLESAGFTEVVFRQITPDNEAALESVGRLGSVRESLGP
jgi:alkanesulfonate monooxygenase SsuD/methylene tetrahydromethanopterin reductase-like flavin-dependent oxidoreductase (luciferase family)